MVLKLREILIKKGASNLELLPVNLCKQLTPDQRERILKWLCAHDRLTLTVIPYISASLLSSPLNSLEFYKCLQLTNDMLISFAKSSPLRRLKSLVIHGCPEVGGMLIEFHLLSVLRI